MPTVMIKNFLKNNLAIILLLLASIVVHFSFLSYPAEVVFDEVYFGTFVNSYFTHQYYFDIHPPLGKLLITGFAKFAGINSGFDFSTIGQTASSQYFFILRFLPALFGSFFPLVIYLLLRQMKLSKKTAFFGAFLVALDNAIVTQSRFILLDIFLLFFGFLALYFYLKSKEEKNSHVFFGISIALVTCCLSIKWTGLSFLGLILLLFTIDSIRHWRWKEFFSKLAILLGAAAVVYCSVFLVHFQLLYKSGTGDAYMSQQFQETLQENKVALPEPPISNWEKFIELNRAMYSYNVGLTATHPYSSKWYQWPIGQNPIWYWTKTVNEKVASIYLFGNPLIWLSVLLGIIFSFVILCIKKLRQKLSPLFYLLLLGYIGNLLPYIFITRAAFLYHYLPSLVFGILILAILHEKIISPFIMEKYGQKVEWVLCAVFLCACFIIFLLLLPINFGFFIPISSPLNAFYSGFIKLIYLPH